MAAEYRPKIELSLSYADKVQEIISMALLLVHVGMVAYAFSDLPETIPTHFNARGEADGWGKRAAVWGLPAIAVFVYTLMTAVNRFPEKFNYPFRLKPEHAEREYRRATRLIRFLKTSIMVLMAALSWHIIATATDRSTSIGPWIGWFTLLVVTLPLLWYLVRGQAK